MALKVMKNSGIYDKADEMIQRIRISDDHPLRS